MKGGLSAAHIRLRMHPVVMKNALVKLPARLQKSEATMVLVSNVMAQRFLQLGFAWGLWLFSGMG